MARNKTTSFRTLLETEEIIMCPNIFDALSAKIAERVGFKSVGLGGYSMGASLGTSEPLIGLEELVRLCRYITALIRIPLKVDAGAGFGEPLHVMRTVRELEWAGVSAIQLEDQQYPKRAHYHKGIEHTIEPDEMVAKIKAACAARTNPDLIIIARTDSMLTHGYDEAIRRANLYLEAGADMAYVFPNTAEEALRAPKEVHGPLIYPNSEAHVLGRPRFTVDELREAGYRLITYPVTSTLITAKALKEMFETLLTTGTTGTDWNEMKEMRRFVEESIGLDEMYKIEEETVEKLPER